MRPERTLLLLIVALPLTACDDLKPSGGQRVPPPDAQTVAPCDLPEQHLAANDWEIVAGRLGLALIQCGQEKAALAAYVTELRRVLE